MSRGARRRGEDRRFTVEAVPRSQPDLHKLAQLFIGMARARAAIRGRDFVTPDDVAALAGAVLPHRLAPQGRFAAEAEAYAAATNIVAEIVARTPVR